MFLRLRPWAEWFFFVVGVVAMVGAIPLVIYMMQTSQHEAHVDTAPIETTVTTERTRDGHVETTSASQFRFEVPDNSLFSCKGKPNCATLSVRDAGEELLRVSTEGNVTVKGDLTVKGKINGAAPAACPVCAPVVCKVEAAPREARETWAALMLGNILGAAVMLAGLKVFDRLS